MGVLRLLKWAGIALFAAVIALFALLYALTTRSLPDYDADYAAPGLLGDVEIVRDSRAVPHIFGGSERDIYFALGFAHAQDRLWQMEVTRRLAAGSLSELIPDWLISLSYDGELADAKAALLRIDETARALDIDGAAARSLDALSPDALRALEAYAAGVNAWLAIVDDDALGAGAPELLLLGAKMAPWRPEDSIAALKILSAVVSSPFLNELARGRFVIALGPERAEDLLPTGGALARSAAARAPRDPSVFAVDETNPAIGALAEALPFPLRLDATPRGGASNAWAVSAARSATRAPLLAADPHLPLTSPSVWYVARLDFGDGGVIGATTPGAPVVLAGRNERIAWGFAALPVDAGDFFIEQVNPEDPSQYRTPDGWAAFERRVETIALNDGTAVETTILRTRHGPVLPLDWPAIAQVTPRGYVAALSWTTLADDDATIEAGLRLMRARSVEEAIRLRPLFTAPAQMLVVADQREIAGFAVGRVPLRRLDSFTRGASPGSGWLAENDWTGFLPADDLPTERNPASGVVLAANTAPATGAFPRHLGHDWPESYRRARLEAMLGNRSLHSLSGFQAMQSDEASEMARRVLPLIADPLWRGLERESGLRRDALVRLRLWYGDGASVEMDALRAEPLIFSAWMRALTRSLVEDELEGRLAGFEGARAGFVERVYRDPDGAGARWCDDRRTPASESCADIASLALDAALEELSREFGGTVAGWRWGRAHIAAHDHVAFGSAPGLDVLFSIEHEFGGGDHTVKRSLSSGVGDTPYRTINAGGLRVIYDFADLDRSLIAISTGQSGHVFSRHFDDFSPIWRTGAYAPLSLSRREAEAASVGVTRLIADPTPAE